MITYEWLKDAVGKNLLFGPKNGDGDAPWPYTSIWVHDVRKSGIPGVVARVVSESGCIYPVKDDMVAAIR
jgi:hypothetical protein